MLFVPLHKIGHGSRGQNNTHHTRLPSPVSTQRMGNQKLKRCRPVVFNSLKHHIVPTQSFAGTHTRTNQTRKQTTFTDLSLFRWDQFRRAHSLTKTALHTGLRALNNLKSLQRTPKAPAYLWVRENGILRSADTTLPRPAYVALDEHIESCSQMDFIRDTPHTAQRSSVSSTPDATSTCHTASRQRNKSGIRRRRMYPTPTAFSFGRAPALDALAAFCFEL